MFLNEIPLYPILSETVESVARLLLEESDAAELLCEKKNNLQNIEDLIGTEHEYIYDACVSKRDGELFHMYGTVYKFRLTDAFKAHFTERGLESIIYLDGTPILENLTLYSGDKRIFTCQSHEAYDLYGMFYICDEFSEKVLSTVRAAIESSSIYLSMAKVYNKICDRPKRRIEREMEILFDIHCYVDRAKKLWIFQPPQEECSFESFKKIAEDYFTAETFAALSAVDSFEELQPLPVPQTMEEAMTAEHGGTQFMRTDVYAKFKRELCVLKYIIDTSSREIN